MFLIKYNNKPIYKKLNYFIIFLIINNLKNRSIKYVISIIIKNLKKQYYIYFVKSILSIINIILYYNKV